MNILYLATDTYGVQGGIALYNRDFISALAAYEHVERITVLPRNIGNHLDVLPSKVRVMESAAGGKISYGASVGRVLSTSPPFDLVICAHINLLPFARMTRQEPLLLIYGIEAWKPRRLSPIRHLVSISELTLRRFRAWAGSATTASLIPNAIDLTKYGVRPRPEVLVSRYLLEGKRVILTVGRIQASERYKGFDEVIETLPALPEDVVYLIAGGGDDIARLRTKVTASGLSHRVRFTGGFPESEKADLYNLGDVYVMPSYGEGFGFVFLEAMAAGMPVIGSRQDGGREALIGGLLGRLVDPSHPAEIRDAVEDALLNTSRRVPSGLEYFDIPHFHARVHALIDDLRKHE